ncbi:MAG: hypothetical protein JRE23_16470 [Deltaproteobacteria bacterium]|nr:hypothetical protein [Deltaproteobacteria bacterium]
MPEETKVDEEIVEDEVKETPSTETKKTDDHMIPQSRLNVVIQERDDAKKRADSLEKAIADAETKRLKESEDYKALYEAEQAKVIELKPKADGADSAHATLKEVLEAQIEAIPDHQHSLVPDELSTEKQLAWIARNRALLSKEQPFDIGAGETGGNGDGKSVTLSPEQKKAARKANVTDEAYAKSIEK